MSESHAEEAAERRRLAVVFIHGLFSSPATWDEMRALLSVDDEMATVRAYFFGYHTSVRARTITQVTPSLDDVADSLSTYLRHQVQESEVVLVCHSQGGLVALRMVARHVVGPPPWDGPKVRLLLLYACPLLGSTFGRRVRRLFFTDHAQEKSLRPLDPATAESIRRVLTLTQAPSEPLSELQVLAVAGASDGIVTPTSAKGFWQAVETVPGDHSSIIRPTAATDGSYVILRKRLLEVLAAPVTHLTGRDVQTSRSFWLQIATEVSARLHFANWDDAMGGLVRTSYALPSSIVEDLHGFSAWMMGRIFPAGQPKLRVALDVIHRVTVDLLDTFNQHAELVQPGADNSWVRVHRWYSAGGFNPNYDRDLQAYSEHVNLLANLALELTRASEWFCEIVREELDPNFRLMEGALLLEVGPYADGDTRIVRPSYSVEDVTEDQPPYVDIHSFRSSSRFVKQTSAEPAESDGERADSTEVVPASRETGPEPHVDQLERQLIERQLTKLQSELDVYRAWQASGSRSALVKALRLAEDTGLITGDGYRQAIWETEVHLRFRRVGDGVSLAIEDDGAAILYMYPWDDGVDGGDAFATLDVAMEQLGQHLGPGLFLPTRVIRDAAEALIFAARYRSQKLNLGSEHFQSLIECVDGWYISANGLFPRDHPYYFIDRRRLGELDWETHVSDKGWDGIHRAMEVARSLFKGTVSQG